MDIVSVMKVIGRTDPPERIQSATHGAVGYPPMVSPNRDPSGEENLGIDKRHKVVVRPETKLEQTHHHPSWPI